MHHTHFFWVIWVIAVMYPRLSSSFGSIMSWAAPGSTWAASPMVIQALGLSTAGMLCWNGQTEEWLPINSCLWTRNGQPTFWVLSMLRKSQAGSADWGRMIYCERSELGGSFVCLPRRKTIWLRGAGRACRVRRDDQFGPLTQAGCGRLWSRLRWKGWLLPACCRHVEA